MPDIANLKDDNVLTALARYTDYHLLGDPLGGADKGELGILKANQDTFELAGPIQRLITDKDWWTQLVRTQKPPNPAPGLTVWELWRMKLVTAVSEKKCAPLRFVAQKTEIEGSHELHL